MSDVNETKINNSEKKPLQPNSSLYTHGDFLGPIHSVRGDNESRDCNSRAIDLIRTFAHTPAITTTAATIILNTTRRTATKALNSLWWISMVKWMQVFTSSDEGRTGTFRLWVAHNTIPPQTAQEACRLAVLALFYAHAKTAVPGFKWRTIRNHKSPPIAEMGYSSKNGSEKWLVDAPRRDELPISNADVYIFPTLEEAQKLTPQGKKFTSDDVLFSDQKFHDKLFQQ